MIRSRCMWLGTAQNQHQTCRFFCCCRIFATVCSFFFLLAVFVGCHAVSLTPLNAYRPMPPKRLLELEGLVGHIALGSEVVEMIPNIPTPMSDASAISHLKIGLPLCASGKLYSTGTWTLSLCSMRGFPACWSCLVHLFFQSLLVLCCPDIRPSSVIIRLHLDICDNFDAENNAHGGNAWVGRIWRCCLQVHSAFALWCNVHSIQSDHLQAEVTAVSHTWCILMLLWIYTYTLHTHRHTMTHTTHRCRCIYTYIYGYQGAKIDMLHVLPTRTDRVIAL